LFTSNGLLPHEELEIPHHPGEEHMEKIILHRFEALPDLGLSGNREFLEERVWGEGSSGRGRAEPREDE